MEAPDIEGYRFERLLGSGGYSDVFLYQQEMPRRPVAIKVLLADTLDERARRQITDEANSMAAVSTHPYIVTIFHADVGRSGNPFLVMEYYPRPNYSVRARTEQLSVAEVLRTGIQVASAVETAHRARIVHRDIKPANILTSEYGRPGLTDFGIAAGLTEGGATEAEGLSLPWSPPEVIEGDGAGDELSDVYSLGATVYTLLAGRSPFEVTGGPNRTLDLLQRISTTPAPPTGRADVPASMERLLRQTMSRNPVDRPPSAAAFARALQDIEVEQRFAMTPLEVRSEDDLGPRARVLDDDGDGTRLKSPTVIHSQSPAVDRAPTGDPTSPYAPGNTSGGTMPAAPSAAPDGTVARSSVVGDGLIGGVPHAGAPLSVAPQSGVPQPGVPQAGTMQPGSPLPGVLHLGQVPAAAAPPFTTGVPGGAPLPGDPMAAVPAGVLAESPTGQETSRSKVLVRVAAGVLAVVALLFVVRAVIGPSRTTSTSTTETTGGTAPPGASPPAPTGVSVGVGANGAEVRWTKPEGAEATDVYAVTPAGKGIEATLVTSDPGAASVTLPAGTTGCVTVWTQRGTKASVVPSDQACLP